MCDEAKLPETSSFCGISADNYSLTSDLLSLVMVRIGNGDSRYVLLSITVDVRANGLSIHRELLAVLRRSRWQGAANQWCAADVSVFLWPGRLLKSTW